MIDLNTLKELLVILAATHGVRRQDMEDSWNEEKADLDWQMNYKRDLNSRLQRDIRGLSGFAGVCDMARMAGDTVALRMAVMRMNIYAMNLTSEFDALAEDLRHIMILEHNAPGSVELPERYSFPDHYREAFPDLNFDA